MELKVLETNILKVGDTFVIDAYCNINDKEPLKKHKVLLGSEPDAAQKVHITCLPSNFI
jgi:hypothetical protein